MAVHHVAEERRAPTVTANPQLEIERRMGRRIVLGVLIAAPLFAAFFALVVLFALRNTDAPIVPSILIGASVGALAGCFAGFWVATVITGPEFEA